MQKKISEKSFDEFKNEPIEKLLNMSDRNLNTLLLELFNRRSKNIIPKDVYQKYNDFYEFFGPSKESLRNIIELDNLFLNCLPEKYEAIELSPITPFGANTCITKLSQKIFYLLQKIPKYVVMQQQHFHMRLVKKENH